VSFLAELKRRNVIRVGVAYVAFAWLIIQVVETLFPIYGLSDSQVRLVVTLLAIGLPLALVFSWLYELTPEGLKLDRDLDRTQFAAGHGGKTLDRLIIVVLALAVGYFAVDKFVLEPARDAELAEAAAAQARGNALVESYGANSIAVLPFENMSEDPDNEFFSDGISEELLNLLSRIPKLRVISRSSSFSFKGKTFTIPEVGAKLNAALVLEGSVRRFGNDVRITAQLIDARSDTHLWSQTYDRTLDNLFAIQDEISAAIVGALRNQLDIDVGNAPGASEAASVEAHDAYLRGRYLIAQRTPESKKQAVREFEQAVTLDPDFAPAHAELAIAIALGGLSGLMPPEQRIEKLTYHANRAMELDPNLPEAHGARGWMLDSADRREEALAEYRRATELNPNYAIAYIWMGDYLSDPAEEFVNKEKALRLDPLSRSANFGYVLALIARNRLDDAERQIEKLATFEPAGAEILRGDLASIGGNWSESALAYLRATNNRPDALVFGGGHAIMFSWTIAALGLNDEAVRRQPDFPEFHAWLGDHDKGVELAEAALENDRSGGAAGLAGIVFAHVGEYDRARPLLERVWEQIGRRFSGDGRYSVLLAEALVAVRRHAGDEAGAQEVIDALADNARRLRDAGIALTRKDNSVDYHDGIVAWVSGDRDKGLAIIARAAADGLWIPPMSAFQEDRFRDPGFAPILEVQEARQRRERAKLLDVVCHDNPYASVWQPLPETCRLVE